MRKGLLADLGLIRTPPSGRLSHRDWCIATFRPLGDALGWRPYNHPWLEATSLSCRLYVASASDKFGRIRRNPAATRRMESTEKIGISSDKSRAELYRRISVAPMMDWSDEVK
jgi:hypothetical protein